MFHFGVTAFLAGCCVVVCDTARGPQPAPDVAANWNGTPIPTSAFIPHIIRWIRKQPPVTTDTGLHPPLEVFNSTPRMFPDLWPRNLTAETADPVLKRLANDKGQIVYTVFGPRVADWPLRWSYHLHRTGMARHSFIIANDLALCAPAAQAGGLSVPCFGHSAGPDVKLKSTWPADLKWYWGGVLLRLGYHTLYLDSDAFPLRNLFTYWDLNPGYDFQGLSDHWPHSRECPVDYPKHAKNLCQSTAIMFMNCTSITTEIVSKMDGYLERTRDWEQRAWQLVMLPRMKLWRWRTNSRSEIMNAVDLEHQVSLRRPIEPWAVHMGHVHGLWNKRHLFQRYGLWPWPEWDLEHPSMPKPKDIVQCPFQMVPGADTTPEMANSLVRDQCADDRKKLCKNQKGPAAGACMQKHKLSLSSGCRAALNEYRSQRPPKKR